MEPGGERKSPGLVQLQLFLASLAAARVFPPSRFGWFSFWSERIFLGSFFFLEWGFEVVGLGILFELMMGLWRSIARPLPPPLPRRRVAEAGEEEELGSMLRHIAVAACDAQNMSTPFIFLEREVMRERGVSLKREKL